MKDKLNGSEYAMHSIEGVPQKKVQNKEIDKKGRTCGICAYFSVIKVLKSENLKYGECKVDKLEGVYAYGDEPACYKYSEDTCSIIHVERYGKLTSMIYVLYRNEAYKIEVDNVTHRITIDRDNKKDWVINDYELKHNIFKEIEKTNTCLRILSGYNYRDIK